MLLCCASSLEHVIATCESRAITNTRIFSHCRIMRSHPFMCCNAFFVRDRRAASVGCQLSQRSHRPDAFSPHQWLFTSRIGTPYALFQLLVFLPYEPFVHTRTERRFEDGDSQRAFALLDSPIGEHNNPFPMPRPHVPRQLLEPVKPLLLGHDLAKQGQCFFGLVVQIIRAVPQ